MTKGRSKIDDTSVAVNVGLSASDVGWEEKDGSSFELGLEIPASFHFEHHEHSKSGEPKIGELKDDNLLTSAILKNKTAKTTNTMFISRLKHLSERNTEKACCKLSLWNPKMGSEDRSISCQRTMLSWLLHSGVLTFGEVIQYQDWKTDSVL